MSYFNAQWKTVSSKQIVPRTEGPKRALVTSGRSRLIAGLTASTYDRDRTDRRTNRRTNRHQITALCCGCEDAANVMNEFQFLCISKNAQLDGLLGAVNTRVLLLSLVVSSL